MTSMKVRQPYTQQEQQQQQHVFTYYSMLLSIPKRLISYSARGLVIRHGSFLAGPIIHVQQYRLHRPPGKPERE